MDQFTLENDIMVFYVTAESFPDGILNAMDNLAKKAERIPGRSIFGLSRPENGGEIVYKAAAEEMKPGEAEKYGLETMVIRKGQYVYLDIDDFQKDVSSIGSAFETLLTTPNLDPNGYCIESYSSDMKSVKCMIRLAQ